MCQMKTIGTEPTKTIMPRPASVAKVLLNTHKKGVKVEVILDKSQRTQKYSSATFLFNAGIPVKIDTQDAITHNKVVIIDGETVTTGSFNFTSAAMENNAENLLVIHDRKLAERYIRNCQVHAQHSEVVWGEGDKVEFEVTKGPKGPHAVNVRVVG
jgi:phosphatidylserine/phosphatidylglycerophosphate/cardiolipin synthase-like enzyme